MPNKKQMIKLKKLNGLPLFLIAIIVLILLFDFNLEIEPRISFSRKNSNNLVAEDGTVTAEEISELEKIVIPAEGIILPIKWDSLGKKMVDDGVIDEKKFREAFQDSLSKDQEKILAGKWDKEVSINKENSRFILDLLWAFGLANKNDILENGEMTSEDYGGDAGKFAATGGWSLAKGDPMDHYSMHNYANLTPEQQALVDEVSRNIYRPCCGNSTHFPDCNHGMAMLGLLELMAANGVGEREMYQVALQVNAYWFPQTYLDLATYFEEQDMAWKEIDPKLPLSQDYSSAQGYSQTRKNIKSLPKPPSGGGGCGI